MNKVILMGRLTRDPEMRNSNGESNTAIARYTLAVDRRYKREGEAGADFISCVWTQCRVCREVFPPGLEDSDNRPHPDRELYQPRWQQGLYNRRGG